MDAAEERRLREVERIAREVVMATTGFISAWEFDGMTGPDGETLHKQLREALRISREEWMDSPTR